MRFFKPGYAAHLVPEWLPALEGVEAMLRRGAAAGVADRVEFKVAKAAGFTRFRRATQTPFNIILEARP